MDWSLAGIYQLEKLALNGDVGKEMGRIAEYGLAVDEGHERQLIGAWNVICGKLNTGMKNITEE